MIDRAALLDLRDRVRALEGPDEAVDTAVWFALAPRTSSQASQPLTSSLDAVVALIAKTRKHFLWQVKCAIECQAIVWWLERDWDDYPVPTGYSLPDAPALALLDAFLTALITEERPEGLLSQEQETVG